MFEWELKVENFLLGLLILQVAQLWFLKFVVDAQRHSAESLRQINLQLQQINLKRLGVDVAHIRVNTGKSADTETDDL